MGGQRIDATLWNGDEVSYLKIGHNENQTTWKGSEKKDQISLFRLFQQMLKILK